MNKAELSQSVIPSTTLLQRASLKDPGKKRFAFSKLEMAAIDMLAKVKV